MKNGLFFGWALTGILATAQFSFAAQRPFHLDSSSCDCVNANGEKGLNVGAPDLNLGSAECSDLRYASLSNLQVAGIDFRGSDLSGADLTGSTITGAVLDCANMAGTILNHVGLRVASLRGAELLGAQISGINLRGAGFDGSTILPFSNQDAVNKYHMVPTADVAGLSNNISVARSSILSQIDDRDSIQIRWTGFDPGSLTPLFGLGDFKLVIQPVLTWNDWQESFFREKITKEVSKVTSFLDWNLGEIILSGAEIRNLVAKAGDVIAGGPPPPREQSGLKIAIDFADERSLFLQFDNRFAPAYIDVADLAQSPNQTKNYVLTHGDAKAEIEVRLIRGGQ